MKRLFLLTLFLIALTGCSTLGVGTTTTTTTPQLTQQQILVGTWLAGCTRYHQWLLSIQPQIATMPIATLRKDVLLISQLTPICGNQPPANLAAAVTQLTAAATTFAIINSVPTTGAAK